MTAQVTGPVDLRGRTRERGIAVIRSPLARLALPGLVLAAVLAGALPAHAQPRVLAREDILLYGIGLKVEPATQTVPKDFATIVSAFLQAPQLPPGSLPPFGPDAEVRATLRGPSFAQPIELVAAPNSPLQIPVLSVPGTHTVENIRLISGGQVVLYGSPESAKIEVIEKLLVTTVTTRALTADEIREKGIVFDKSNFQAYNFTAAFAIDDGSKIDISFPVVLPTLLPPQDVTVGGADLPVNVPQLRSLRTLVPDTLRIQQRIPNLQVVGFTLTLDDGQPQSQNLVLPPIPGVVVIPGDIGFLNQFFSVMLMVGNVAPTGSNLVVRDLGATLVLPAGNDNVVGSDDDPLRMARRATGEFAARRRRDAARRGRPARARPTTSRHWARARRATPSTSWKAGARAPTSSRWSWRARCLACPWGRCRSAAAPPAPCSCATRRSRSRSRTRTSSTRASRIRST